MTSNTAANNITTLPSTPTPQTSKEVIADDVPTTTKFPSDVLRSYDDTQKTIIITDSAMTNLIFELTLSAKIKPHSTDSHSSGSNTVYNVPPRMLRPCLKVWG